MSAAQEWSTLDSLRAIVSQGTAPAGIVAGARDVLDAHERYPYVTDLELASRFVAYVAGWFGSE